MTAGMGASAAHAQLPPVDQSTGFLPPGIHPCSWAELEQVFVDEAPHRDHRRRRLHALEVYVESLDELLPGSTLWVDGGFVSHKRDPPFDIDVLVKAKPGAWAALMKLVDGEQQAFAAWVQAGQQGYPPKTPNLTQLSGLMTHQDVNVSGGGYFPRIQPFGGRVDGFIVPADSKQVLDRFRREWMVDISTGVKKGFVEVKPDVR